MAIEFAQKAGTKPKKATKTPTGPVNKVAVSIRLDSDVVDGFKAGGAGWQVRINAALRSALKLK